MRTSRSPSDPTLEKLRQYSSACSRFLVAQPRLARTVHRAPLLEPLLLRAAHLPKPLAARLLRQARKRLFLHTARRELDGTSPLETARLWSDFADNALRLADLVVIRELEARFGEPRSAHGSAVGRSILGLGKLGARELNPSSDVDLLFAYESDDAHAAKLSAHEFFVRWVRGVRELLADIDEDGFVFRVDLDLRPEGTTGALVNSLDALENYYERFGRTWERAAMSRLRPIVDVHETGRRLCERLRPFVFPRTVDVRWIDDLADMKQLVTLSAVVEGVDVKRGQGAIREVEFIVQSLQLVHGGRAPSLRQGSVAELLGALEEAGLLGHRTARELRDAYVALRRIEHALQYEGDRQTQVLPAVGPLREKVAQALLPHLVTTRRGVQTFDEVLDRHRARVHRVFSSLLVERREGPSGLAEKAVERTAPDEERLHALEELQLEPAEDSLRLLRVLERRSNSPFSPSLLASRSGLASLGPRLLDDIAQCPDPRAALARLPELFTGYVHHSFYERLVSDGRLRSLLMRVLSTSAPLARLLMRQAGLEAVLLHGLDARRLSRVHYRREFEDPSDDEELRLTRMRRVQGRAMLETGLAFSARKIDVVRAGHRLSALADTLLEEALSLARAKVHRRFGEPSDARFGIFALGRLGSRELGFFADVDIVFVYDAHGATTGPRSIDAADWAARVAQQTIWSLSAPLPEGRCYEVDTRLRPSGNQGPLVTGLDAFATYHRTRAEIWERQALLRIRPIAGDSSLLTAVMRNARSAAQSQTPSRVGAHLLEMRARMVHERASSTAGLDLKLGEGGISDIEFAVQGAQLKFAQTHPFVLTSSTRVALHRLTRAHLIPPEQARILDGAFHRFSTLREALTLMDDKKGAVVTPRDRRLDVLVAMWPQFPAANDPALRDQPSTTAQDLHDSLAQQAAIVRETCHRILVRL